VSEERIDAERTVYCPRPRRVLVVDDNRDLAENLVEILDEHGILADLFDDPRRAVLAFVPGRYTVALLDLRMPWMDGVELFRELRRHDPHLAAVALTAYAHDERVRAALHEGVAQVLPKPIDTDSLLAVMARVEAALQESNSGRLLRRTRSVEEIRAASYRQDRAMMSILTGTMLAMMLITGLGIIGLTSFWVTRRIKQIGTRRALGARRLNIRAWFQTENGLMIALGVAVGAVLTYGFNAWLMQTINAQRLPWHYLPIGALAVFALGQLAVLGPAGRAASVPPALATRTA